MAEKQKKGNEESLEFVDGNALQSNFDAIDERIKFAESRFPDIKLKSGETEIEYMERVRPIYMEFQLKMALSGDAKAINSINTLQSIREESQGAVLKLLNGRLPPALEKRLSASQTGAPSGSAIGRLLNGELKIDA